MFSAPFRLSVRCPCCFRTSVFQLLLLPLLLGYSR